MCVGGILPNVYCKPLPYSIVGLLGLLGPDEDFADFADFADFTDCLFLIYSS